MKMNYLNKTFFWMLLAIFALLEVQYARAEECANGPKNGAQIGQRITFITEIREGEISSNDEETLVVNDKNDEFVGMCVDKTFTHVVTFNVDNIGATSTSDYPKEDTAKEYTPENGAQYGQEITLRAEKVVDISSDDITIDEKDVWYESFKLDVEDPLHKAYIGLPIGGKITITFKKTLTNIEEAEIDGSKSEPTA